MKEQIHIFTDGSSLGNPGPGGYGVILRFKQVSKELNQGYERTTNNRMELMADTYKDKEVVIHTDSKYVMNAVEKGWLFHWQRIQFKNKKNPDLWRRFLKIYPKYDMRFEWVKGHSGHPENERCDQLAKEAAKKEPRLIDTGFEQGQNSLF